MYPFDFKPEEFWLGSKHFFVAMPFHSDCKKIYTELIKPAVTQYSKDYKPWKADEDVTTKVGWSTILEKLYSARLVIGVLDGENQNVYYELGIAHATQPIERQILLAPQIMKDRTSDYNKISNDQDKKNFKSPFDLQHLVYSTYNLDNLEDSISDLVKKITDQMKCINLENDRTVKKIIKQITPKELEIMEEWGNKYFSNGKNSSHFFLKKFDLVKYEAYCYLIKLGLLRFSVDKCKGENGSYSYYWTYLGNAVLYSLDIISKSILLKRIEEYRDHEEHSRFLVVKNELNFTIPND